MNIYMFHGGTNFGFTNGADYDGTYRPLVTSYDYQGFAVYRRALPERRRAQTLTVADVRDSAHAFLGDTEQAVQQGGHVAPRC